MFQSADTIPYVQWLTLSSITLHTNSPHNIRKHSAVVYWGYPTMVWPWCAQVWTKLDSKCVFTLYWYTLRPCMWVTMVGRHQWIICVLQTTNYELKHKVLNMMSHFRLKTWIWFRNLVFIHKQGLTIVCGF